jgi:hypothetical protein
MEQVDIPRGAHHVVRRPGQATNGRIRRADAIEGG